MASTGFMGLRSTADFATNQLDYDWRMGLLLMFPNGKTPLTGLTALMKKEKAKATRYDWWTKTHQRQGGTITGIYTNLNLTTAYTSGAVEGATLFIKLAEADARDFRIGHQVCLRDASDMTVDVNGLVRDVVYNGASSYLAVELLEDDDNSTVGDLSDADTVVVIGNLNSQAANRPPALHYDPVDNYNYTQIFRTPFEMSRTAMQTEARTGNLYAEEKRESLEYHGVEMEKAFLFGRRWQGVGANGKPMTATHGLIRSIQDDNPTGVGDYISDEDFDGVTWENGGVEFLEKYFEIQFRYGDSEKLMLLGSGAAAAINKVVRATSTMNITPATTEFGWKVNRWDTFFGSILFKTHPLFTQEPTLRNAAVIFEPRRLKYRFIQDTVFRKAPEINEETNDGMDGKREEFLTECGLEYHFPETAGFLTNLGSDNPAS